MFITRIDIEKELKAMSEGQCGCCRIGSTHYFNESCSKTPLRRRWVMLNCEKCGHTYSSVLFTECPICNLRKGEDQC
jgi:hypothetical protein